MRSFLAILLLTAALALAPALPIAAAPAQTQLVGASWSSWVDGLFSWWSGVLSGGFLAGVGPEGTDDRPIGDTGPLVEPDGLSAPGGWSAFDGPTGDLGPAVEPDGLGVSSAPEADGGPGLEPDGAANVPTH